MMTYYHTFEAFAQHLADTQHVSLDDATRTARCCIAVRQVFVTLNRTRAHSVSLFSLNRNAISAVWLDGTPRSQQYDVLFYNKFRNLLAASLLAEYNIRMSDLDAKFVIFTDMNELQLRVTKLGVQMFKNSYTEAMAQFQKASTPHAAWDDPVWLGGIKNRIREQALKDRAFSYRIFLSGNQYVQQAVSADARAVLAQYGFNDMFDLMDDAASRFWGGEESAYDEWHHFFLILREVRNACAPEGVGYYDYWENNAHREARAENSSSENSSSE